MIRHRLFCSIHIPLIIAIWIVGKTSAFVFGDKGATANIHQRIRSTFVIPYQSIHKEEKHQQNYYYHNRHGNPCQKSTFLNYATKTSITIPNTKIKLQQSRCLWRSNTETQQQLHMIYAPPGSGYQSIDDEVNELPSTYEPMMEYPGTMRPGKTPENMPFQDLPIGDHDPDPVPWPHFQQHEWHTTIWSQYPPHDHPIPMEKFIELQGRWATPELEASMRRGYQQRNRGVNNQEQQRLADELKNAQVITDDDDYDDDFADDEEDDDDFGSIDNEKIAQALGDGIFGKLGSDDDKALTAAATSASVTADAAGSLVSSKQASKKSASSDDVDDDMILPPFDDEEDLDDFLLGLGLDSDLDLGDDDDNIPITKSDSGPATIIKSSNAKQPKPNKIGSKSAGMDDDDEDDDDDDESSVNEFIDPMALGTLGLDDDDDDMIGGDGDDIIGGRSGVNTVPLEDFGDNDSLDGSDDNVFDEGGFDYDDDFGDIDASGW